MAHDRWPGAVEVLDFYPAGQPVWDPGESLVGERPAARPWGGRHNGINSATHATPPR